MKENQYLYISYNEHCSNVVEDTYGDDGPYTGFCEEDWEFNLDKAYLKPPAKNTPYWEQVELIGDLKGTKFVYVMYVLYSTGGTFSRDNGRGHIVKAYVSKEDALKDQLLIEEDNENLSKRRRDYGHKLPKYKNQWAEYAPWNGYFKRMESVNIQIMEIENES